MNFAKLPVLRHGLMLRHEDVLPNTAVTERIQTVRKLMQRESLESLIIFSDAVRNGPVCYLTNYPCYGLGRRAVAVLSLKEGPFLYTAEPSRNLPRVRHFTSCDLEKMRRFLPGAMERVKNLSQGGTVGLVGFTNFPVGLMKDIEKDLSGLKSKDVSQDFTFLLATKDESSLKATERAVELAEEGIKFLKAQAASGKDLWQLAAYVDYRLRLLGCEDTNILLGCSAGGRVRPGYPAHIRPSPGDMVVAYIAVQYARLWGVVGATLSIGSASNKLNDKLVSLSKIQNRLAPEIRAGMILGQVEAIISEFGRQAGLTLAQDLPMAAGVGFDLLEYPASTDDRVEKNMVLQVALAVDVDDGFTPHPVKPRVLTRGAGFTAMLVNMLQITSNGGVWLSRTNKNTLYLL